VQSHKLEDVTYFVFKKLTILGGDVVLIRNELRGRADSAGLPTYTVADAGRTQVLPYSRSLFHLQGFEISDKIFINHKFNSSNCLNFLSRWQLDRRRFL
jgi:hypothetical protein